MLKCNIFYPLFFLPFTLSYYFILRINKASRLNCLRHYEQSDRYNEPSIFVLINTN